MNPLVYLLLPEVREMIVRADLEALRASFENFHPADLAELIGVLEPAEAAVLFQALENDAKVWVFEMIDEDRQVDLIAKIGLEGMAPTIEDMASDDRADLFKRLPERSAEALLPLLARAERQDVKRLVAHPEGTAGSIMSTEYATIDPEMTVGEAIDHLRRIAPRKETIYYAYVTASDRTLLGIVSLRALILARKDQRIREIMNPDAIALTADADQEEVVRTIEKYDCLAVPIVDGERKLVGIVTHDDVLDVVEEEATEDAQKMGAVAPLEDPYLRTGFWSLAQKRAGWLALLFFGEMFTGTALARYEHVLDQMIALVFFIPLIISTGGNSGSQSASLIIRAMALGELSFANWWQVLRRELLMGVALGGILGLVGFARAWVLYPDEIGVAVVVCLTLLGIVAFGAVAGGLLPIALARLGLDPAVASSPFIASLVDVAGIVIYLNVAQLVLF